MHHHDAVGVAEHHVHVVLDDDGRNRSGAHHRGDGIHDLGLVARAHAARGLVEKEQLGAQRIGDGDVEELALALRQPARQHRGSCRAGRTGRAPRSSRARTAWSWSAKRAIFTALPSREKIDKATLSKTESPSNRLTIWKLRAMPALMRSWTGVKVMSLPSNRIWPLSGLRCALIRLTSDGLAGAVRADERKEFALVHDEIHAVAGFGFAELFSKLDGLEKDHSVFSCGRSLGDQFGDRADDPGRQQKHEQHQNEPSRSCQYSVVATA